MTGHKPWRSTVADGGLLSASVALTEGLTCSAESELRERSNGHANCAKGALLAELASGAPSGVFESGTAHRDLPYHTQQITGTAPMDPHHWRKLVGDDRRKLRRSGRFV
jgi:hypothetical protein